MEGSGFKAVFVLKPKVLELKVRSEVLDELENCKSGLEAEARRIMKASLYEFFEEKLLLE